MAGGLECDCPWGDAQAASGAEWWVRKEQEKALFDQLFTRLREKYADRVAVFEERLGALAAN